MREVMHPDGNRLGNDTAVKKVLRYFSLSVHNISVFHRHENTSLISKSCRDDISCFFLFLFSFTQISGIIQKTRLYLINWFLKYFNLWHDF